MADPRVLVTYWLDKGYNAKTMYAKLLNRMESNIPAYSTVTYWIRELKRGREILEPLFKGGMSHDIFLDPQILAQLELFPFHSIRSLAATLQRPRSTIYDHLVKLGFTTRNLRWVPHALSEKHKKSRVEISRQLLNIIFQARHQGWRFFFTGDESWFYFANHYNRIWLLPDSEVPTRVRNTINADKVMLTVFWSPLGFAVVEVLAKKKTFTSDYFCETICTKLVTCAPEETRRVGGRQLTVHMDNASPHRSKQTTEFMRKSRLISAPHPPYSPDLAPSDFYLFGKVKDLLKGQEFNSAEELLEAIITILKGITREELDSVFANWEKRLERCIALNGDYVE
jgi:histone-lysine N-methyltransferase SETMAR